MTSSLPVRPPHTTSNPCHMTLSCLEWIPLPRELLVCKCYIPFLSCCVFSGNQIKNIIFYLIYSIVSYLDTYRRWAHGAMDEWDCFPYSIIAKYMRSVGPFQICQTEEAFITSERSLQGIIKCLYISSLSMFPLTVFSRVVFFILIDVQHLWRAKHLLQSPLVLLELPVRTFKFFLKFSGFFFSLPNFPHPTLKFFLGLYSFILLEWKPSCFKFINFLDRLLPSP